MTNEIPEGYYRISIKALVLNEDRTKFMLIKDETGHWDLPGGGIKWGENVVECLEREIEEEMGLQVENIENRPSYFFTFVNESVKYAYTIYETILSKGEFTTSDECEEIRLVSIEEARSLLIRPNVEYFLGVCKI